MTRLIVLVLTYFLGFKVFFETNNGGKYVYRPLKGQQDITFFENQLSDNKTERSVYVGNQEIANYFFESTPQGVFIYVNNESLKIIDFSKVDSMIKNPLDNKCFPFLSNYHECLGFKEYKLNDKTYRIIKVAGHGNLESSGHKLTIQYYLDNFGLIVYQDFFKDNIIRFVRDKSDCEGKEVDADELAKKVMADKSFFYSIQEDTIKTKNFIPPKKQ